MRLTYLVYCHYTAVPEADRLGTEAVAEVVQCQVTTDVAVLWEKPERYGASRRVVGEIVEEVR